MASKPKNGKRKTGGPISPDKLSQYIRLTEAQARLNEAIKRNQIIFAYGPGGSAKTLVSCYAAMHLLAEGNASKIILSKPYVESGEKLGFLPGDVSEKTEPFIQSYKHNLYKIADPLIIDSLWQEKVLDFQPLAYMRGVTYDDCIMLLDEGQNATLKQLMLFVTRMGKNSKVIITGDITQHDIAADKVALPVLANMLEGINGVTKFEFTSADIVRNSILIEVTEKYENWKQTPEAKKHI